MEKGREDESGKRTTKRDGDSKTAKWKGIDTYINGDSAEMQSVA